MNKLSIEPAKNHTFTIAEDVVRQNNSAMFVYILRQLKKLREVSGTPLEFEASRLSAEILRLQNNPRGAAELIERIISNPPVGILPSVAAAQRLAVSLRLDFGDFNSAAVLVQEIDGMVIENSEASQSISICSRSAAEVSVETRLAETEIFLFLGDLAKAAQALEDAVEKMSEYEKDLLKRQNPRTLKRMRLRNETLRYEIHIWGAVLQIISGNLNGIETLKNLLSGLTGNLELDRKLTGKVNALLGNFDVLTEIPPAGIGFLEADRLFKLVTPGSFDQRSERIIDTVFSGNTLESTSQSLETGSALQTSPSATDQILLSILRTQETMAVGQTQMAAILEKVNNVRSAIEGIPLQPQPVKHRPFAFGGGFQHFDLSAQLSAATEVNFTGFFQVQWSPEKIETTILAKFLPPEARLGEGFIFMLNGYIIDATIGSYDIDESNPPGTLEGKADAIHNLTIMLQISTGQKLDCSRENLGFGAGYDSMAVKARPPRINLTNLGMASLIAKRGDALNF